jgi:methylmalonyl-CoA/ethylmalonyl-CoA epimerase
LKVKLAKKPALPFFTQKFILSVMKIEHLGVAVSSIATSDNVFAKLFNVSPYKSETVESEGVTTSFFHLGNAKIELLEATRPDSPIAKYIEKRGEGLHHVAFEVEDIEAEMERLRSQGIRLLNEAPKKGADNKLVCFVHPKDCGGVLVELCQEIRE